MSDRVRRFMLQGAPVRGEIVTLDEAWREVVSRHDLPAAVRDRLGELSAAALLLAATLKFDGALVMQVQGDGPVALLVVECQTDGRYRATVKLRENAGTIDEQAPLPSLVDAGGRGRFVVTLDPRSDATGRQPWQGIVPLDGDTIAEVLERYMLQSEQLPTRMWLAADDRRAVGLLLQRLPDEGGHKGASEEKRGASAGTSPTAKRRAAAQPGETATNDVTDVTDISDVTDVTDVTDITDVPDITGADEAWERMQHLAGTITPAELLGLPAEQVLHRLFWQESLHGFDSHAFRFACNCSRDKVIGMLKLLGSAEVDSIVAERGGVEVRCDFCNQLWELDAVDCALVFADGEIAPGSTSYH